ncbi:MAG: S8 family serine peptidase [Lunatimonas sp.]|uniref:S8 family serine peptidase n=1 Tax=Lunatimonas sp. TaxID=2060141 RepID=UPI00263B8084|nr:S8 family serine peptidase [Lunatimonas sp.]MCC5937975.1 S8 family serine peptidase [Lunatimonas sp.]
MPTTQNLDPKGGSSSELFKNLIHFRLNPANIHQSVSLARKIKAAEIQYSWTEKGKMDPLDLIFLESQYFPDDLLLLKTNSGSYSSLVNFKGDPAERSSILHYQYSFKACAFGKGECCLDVVGRELNRLSPTDFQPLDKRMNEGKLKQIVIAVLDTGIVPGLIPEEYLWEDPSVEKEGDFLDNVKNGVYGRNFVSESESPVKDEFGKMVLRDPVNLDITDDYPLLHGTMMCAYIINQFRDSEYAVKIMCLKTHKSDGTGNLEDIYRAIHFARYHEADFIHASWVFPANMNESYSILRDGIQQAFFEKNTLLVTVSGNKDNESANQHFFPAKFGDRAGNHPLGVLVAVTVSQDHSTVSPFEVSDKTYVDFGVPCDKEEHGHYLFELPLKTNNGELYYQQGGSIAAAITTGFLASRLPEMLYLNRKSRGKQGFLEYDSQSTFLVYPELADGIIGGRVLNLAQNASGL